MEKSAAFSKPLLGQMEEGVQTLQLRKKWVKLHRNIQVNDTVLVKGENTPRNTWKLAKVKETFPSDDGLVRKAKLSMATPNLDKQGRRNDDFHFLERPVHKLVLVQEGNREFSNKEPSTK